MTTIEKTPTSVLRRRQFIELFVASLVGLYFEMLIVRWLAAEVRLFSYFKNLTLMAAFMGLGLGFALVKRHTDYRGLFIPFLLLYVPIVLIVSRLTGFRAIVLPESSEYVWRAAALPQVVSTSVFALTLVLFFLLTMFLFLPLGQLTGRLMMGLPPLTAYLVNILGSLVGIWVFTGVSYLRLPPWIWFILGLSIMMWFMRQSRLMFAASSIFSSVIVGVLAISQGETLWSPYYRIDIMPMVIEGKAVANPEQTGYDLYVNQIGHMFAANLSPQHVASHPEYAEALHIFSTLYDLPYAFIQPEKVLIVGAGMGNDVAAALRHGVLQIDAVEIDPVIYQLGTRLHPERPYASPNVNIIIDDARSYLEKTDQRYDLIVFGILDSQTLLSGMSSVRLDNFVYTVESLRQARTHLNPNGIVALTFDVERWWIEQRLGETLLEVFGRAPIQLSVAGTAWTIYISGYDADPAHLAALCKKRGCIVRSPQWTEPIPLATDDWPYLYLEQRSIPMIYWVTLLVVLVIAWVSTRKAFPDARRIDWHFFLLGGAFLLIEFRIVTELALLFGSTWIVNTIAVSAVLVMVLLANLMVGKLWQANVNLLYVLLLLSLLVGFLTPLKLLLPYGVLVRMVVSCLLMGLPLFFSSAIFATSLKRTQDTAGVFSSNFLGSAVGGVLEYGSLAFGISSLYLFGAALYVSSWLARSHQ
jgi:hypothetical protein